MRRIFRRPRFWLMALVLITAGSVAVSFALQRRVTLREMLQVQMGMSKLEVQQILGRPDMVERDGDQVHWLYRGSPESLEERLPGQAFYWVVVFDAGDKELGWDDETRMDDSLIGALETRLNRRLGR
ncbi:MAG TPA: outer membrane protein assembly factor BamE [Gemmataceae bacterium]|nr:outer membrane protein assembly factor BamE [Gemmataceae bacterium]